MEVLMKKTIYFLSWVLLLVLVITGISFAEGQREEASAGKSGKPTVVLVPKSVGHPFWADLEKGMEEQAAEKGMRAIFHGPQTATAAGQIEIIEDFLSMGVDGIAIAANDPATIKTYVKKGLEMGVKMITFDTDAPDSGRICYVGTDNVAAGKQGAKALIKMMNGKGKVVIMTGGLTALNLNQRIEGFKAAIQAHPDIEIITTESHGDSLETGIPIMENLLVEYPDIDAFYCVSGPNVAAAGLKNAGYAPNEKIVFGFDIFEPVPTLIREGYIQGTVAQLPYKEGKLVIDTFKKLLAGETVDEIIGTGTNVVTIENLDSYLSEVH
jgi:ribose transport system substrate-binding protein